MARLETYTSTFHYSPQRILTSGNASDMHWGDAKFETWPGHTTVWLRFLVVVLSPAIQIPAQYLNQATNAVFHILLNSSFTNNRTLTRYTVYDSDRVVKWTIHKYILIINPLQTEFLLNNIIYKSSSYLTGNILLLHYKAQPVNAVWGNSRCLLWEPYGTHRYTLVDRTQCFSMLKQVVRILTTRL
jgi:hypothetical protein